MAEKINKLIEEAKKRFTAAAEAEAHLRFEAQENIRFESGEQWEEFDRLQREEDGRPCLTINKTAATVKQVVGDALKNRPRIKVRGVDSQSDPEKAKKITGLIKNIENISDAESAYDWAFNCAAKSGFGYWKITTDYADDDIFDQDILIDRVTDQFSIYLDPDHRKPTGEDSKFAYELTSIHKEVFEEEYPGKSPVSWDVTSAQLDTEDDHVWICRYWYMVPIKRTIYQLADGSVVKPKKPVEYEAPGPMDMMKFVYSEEMPMPVAYINSRPCETFKVKHVLLSGVEELESPQDWAGKYIPIVQVIGEESWVDGYKCLRPVFHHAKDAQRLYNWSRSLAAETLAMAPRQPWIGTPEMFEGHEDQWDVAHRKVMPYLVANIDGGMLPQRQAQGIPDTGAYTEAQVAADDIKATTGIYDASLGARSNETSGRAIMMRQSEGDTATFAFHDNLSKSIQYTGKILVDLIPKIYDTARVIRILNEDGTQEPFPINQPMPGRQELFNDITIGKYDVYVDTGPSYATQRMENVDSIVQIMQFAPQLAPILVPRLVRMLDFPDAQDIFSEIQQMMQQQSGPSPEDQMNMQKQQLDLQGKELVNTKRQIDIAKDMQEQTGLEQRIGQLEQVLGRMLGAMASPQ